MSLLVDATKKMQAPLFSLIIDLDDDEEEEGSDGSASCVILKTEPGRLLIFLACLVLAQVMSPLVIVTYWFRKQVAVSRVSDTVTVYLYV